MIFTTDLRIRFAHCDPAGIVFYPRYFEMINGVVEDWCAQGLGYSFHEMHVVCSLGLPTVRLETDFVKVSKLGETLRAELSVTQLGGASLELALRLVGPDGDLRVKVKLVLVMMDLKKHRAVAIPPALRERMQDYLSS